MKTFIKIIIIFLMIGQANGQETSFAASLKRAKYLLDNQELEEAGNCIDSIWNADPKEELINSIRGMVYAYKNEYGKALAAFNQAINASLSTQAEVVSFNHFNRADVYANLGDTLDAIQDYIRAAELTPEDSDIFYKMADLFFDIKEYSLSDSCYHEALKTDKANPFPYYGLSRNRIVGCNDYDKALEYLDYAAVLEGDHKVINKMRLNIAYLAKHYEEALDLAITSVEQDSNPIQQGQTILLISEEAYEQTVARLKKKLEQDSNNYIWNLLLSQVYWNSGQYREAFSILEPYLSKKSAYQQAYLILGMKCLQQLEENDRVIALAHVYLDLEPSDANGYLLRADARFYEQDWEGAAADYRKVMNLDRDYAYYCCYRIGWIHEMNRQYENALEYYDLALLFNNTHAYSYLMRGNILKDYLNRPDEAKEAFQMCIEYDGEVNDETCKQYAYLALGDEEQAIAICDSILDQYPNGGCYYDAACLYSRMGRKEKAVSYLQKAFEKGYKRIKHVEADDDLDNIRKMPSYIKLIRKWKKLLNNGTNRE